jgi:2-oxoglutarate dehydrogenase E1 component
MTLYDDFHGPNAGYILELYERYRQNPQSVDAATRAYFEKSPPPGDGAAPVVAPSSEQLPVDKIVGAVNYAQAIRNYGHLIANLDPLGSPPIGDPSLALETHGITEADLRQLPASLVGGALGDSAISGRTALDAIQALLGVYCSTIGYDYDHVRAPDERVWLREAAESERFRPPLDPINEHQLLDRLTQVESFERFLHRIFPGKFRFSIEGLDMMVPMLDEVIGEAAESGIYTVLIGMAHRGRLNVLAHILNKPYAELLAEFKDPVNPRKFRADLGWTGDVKYHAGARRAIDLADDPIDLMINMAPNPSHLEAVNPVVEGMARAAGTRVDRPGEPVFDPRITLPIVIHGDAAFPGQGIVAETLNLSRLFGYWTGGTIHIISNNQLGYTTETGDARSTIYASDLAKGFKIPIVHVNADDPEACIEVARMAFAYRAQFQRDFLIDLLGYRRYGHNESDEPAFTQPMMYQKIANHPTVREQWAQTLAERNMVDAAEPEKMMQQRMEELQGVLASLNPEEDLVVPQSAPPPPGAARRVKTAVAAERLRALNSALLTLPPDFTLHSKLQRAMSRRASILDNPAEKTIEWATAEELALATILEDSIAVRFTGQDVERGTFSQRHAVFHCVESGKIHVPLQSIPQAKAAFEIHNSPLSENAVLGFEYGYNVQEPGRLVLWEAQYGDFNNGAQTIIDEFISSARDKWGQTPSLVMLLPHGLEGSGPDHASARLERFLQLCAETNMRVVNCTTAAQYFHLLRRQAALLKSDPLPLIVMTPKSLLRNPYVASSLNELTNGGWQPVIDDVEARERVGEVRSLLLCSGKIYVDLVSNPLRAQTPSVAIARLEQLYPFPTDDLRPIMNQYSNLDEVVWVQEEPENMGAWEFVGPLLHELIDGRWPLHYLGRPRRSSPAEGSAAMHMVNQEALVSRAFHREAARRNGITLERSYAD